MITRCLLTFLFTAVTKVVRTSDVRIDVIRYVFHLSNVLLGFYTLLGIAFWNRNASTGHIALLAMWIQNGSYPPAKFDVNWYSIFIFYIFYCIRIGNEFLNLQRKGSWNSNSTLSSVSLWRHPEVVSICTVTTVSRENTPSQLRPLCHTCILFVCDCWHHI